VLNRAQVAARRAQLNAEFKALTAGGAATGGWTITGAGTAKGGGLGAGASAALGALGAPVRASAVGRSDHSSRRRYEDHHGRDSGYSECDPG
jgi:hypothetical protein